MNKKVIFIALLGILFIPLLAKAADAYNTILAVKNIVIALGAAIIVIGWVVTGILYLTAGGAPDKLGTAKKALIACVIGTAAIIISSFASEFVSTALNLNNV